MKLPHIELAHEQLTVGNITFDNNVTTSNVGESPIVMNEVVLNEAMQSLSGMYLADAVNELCSTAYNNAVDAGWWTDLNTGQRKERNAGELMMLFVSEIAEAFEGERKNLMDDKLPHRKMVEVELADLLIRVFDFAGSRGYDLGGAIIEKMNFNKTREDHKIENRKKENGKKF